ncbi:MAG: hypothetical protein FH756_10195 [Firmicutes bacterium]|nr:hypothetical protein [Bacillota bacterium]
MLNYLCQLDPMPFTIWPFQDIQPNQSVFVEIFPRLYYVLADQDPKIWGELSTVNNVLAYFRSQPLTDNSKITSEDEADAIVSAAAIRHLASNYKTWQPPEMDNCARVHEGWIFGV